MSQLVIWDKETQGFLKYFNVSEEGLVCNQQEFENKLSDSKESFDQIIILAELEWENNYVQNFYGFQLATQLRRDHKITCPIVITSFFPKEHFERLSKNKPEEFNIIYAPGTGFIDLTEIKEKQQKNKDFLSNYIENLPELSPPLLEDINEMLLSLRGFIIDKITHDLKFQYPIDHLKRVLNDVKSYLSKGQLERISFDENQVSILEAREQGLEDQFIKAKKRLCDICEAELGTDSNTLKSVKTEDKKIGKILVIEDDPDQSEKIRKHLEHRFELIVTNDCYDAIREIEKDGDNDIIAIIADWRLLKYERSSPTGYWQDYQGYQVLQKATQTHFIALISLTAENDKNVHQIRNQLGLDIQLFKKEHVYSENNTTQWEIFADVITKKCEEIENLRASQPTGANWKKLKPKYLRERNKTSWPVYKEALNNESNLLWNYYKFGLEKRYKNEIKNLESLGIEIKNNLRNTLLIRRIFLALLFSFRKKNQELYYSAAYAADDATTILKQQFFTESEVDISSLRQRFANALCIKITKLKMLPEEENWLKKQGVDIHMSGDTSKKIKQITDQGPSDETIKSAFEEWKSFRAENEEL